MIIGISGKIGSGKDTVGTIIQLLTVPKNLEHNTQEILDAIENNFNTPNYVTWDIKKFADKLKDIVCLLIGCTREQLEDREFKEKELGEEWWYWTVSYTCSPDKTEGGLFASEFEAKEYYYNLGGSDEELEHNEINSIINLVKLTPRKILQLLGTEAGRNIIHPNIWVNALFSDYIDKYRGLSIINAETKKEVAKYAENESHWIITDVRFPNELKAVKDRGGISIRINKEVWQPISKLNNFKLIEVKIEGEELPYLIDEYKNGRFYYKGKEEFIEELVISWRHDIRNDHPSETALDNAEFDYIINNNGTIEELIEKVREILIKENII